MTDETPKDDFPKRAMALLQRAAHHGIELKPGEPILDVIEKFLKRLDQYRDKPEYKGRILIE